MTDQTTVELAAEAERFKRDYLNACKTIADMHAAATGYDDRGPERGVVEDVADVRARMLAAEAAIERVRERCQGARDRNGPGGMINASQILDLLSPTWPDGNYEAPPPGAALDGTEQPTTEQQPLRVTPCDPPRMAVHCGGECLPILDSDPDRDRIDRIALVGDTLKVYTGTLGGPPPSCGTGAHLIAEVEVPRGTTAITAEHITGSGLIFYRPTTKG